MSDDDLPWLDANNECADFPHPEQALKDPDGLLAVGGDLSTTRILNAYKNGIFPWYSAEQPILWWSPNPRGVLWPRDFIVHKSLKRLINKGWKVTYDQDFEAVIRACAEPRADNNGTWVTEDMIQAYCELHQLGFAHSIEVWHADKLVGGVYGIAVGKLFAGESMFSRQTGGSKIALLYLAAYLDSWDYALIDTQLPTEHLSSLGGCSIPRADYLSLVEANCNQPVAKQAWRAGQDVNIKQWLCSQSSQA